MYNGIGLQTARGTGTNGYVQSNLSHLLLSRKRVEYNAEEDIARAEAALNRKPNEDLLDHQRKRQIELKCTEFEMLMENKGFEQEDIDKKVADYRRLLLSQLESGELNVDDEICLKDSHARQKYAAQKRAQWKEALRIDKDFKPGSSMQNMNKEGDEEDAAALAEKAKAEEEAARLKKLVKIARKEQKKKEKEAKRKRKAKKAKQAAKKKKRAASSSSSSSSSSDSDSDSDSSDSDSSDSDSDSSASSSDSDREERKRRKAKAKRMLKKTNEKEKERAREVKKEVDSDEERRGRGGRGDRRDERGEAREEKRDDRRREDDRRRPAREDSRERRRARNSSSDRDQRRRNRRDSSAEEERGGGRRKEGGKDKEIKQEPLSDSDAAGRQEGAAKSRRSGSRSASPYVDSDVSDDTRHRMRSMVTVVKK